MLPERWAVCVIIAFLLDSLIGYPLITNKVVLVVKYTPRGERVESSLRIFVPTGQLICHSTKIWICTSS